MFEPNRHSRDLELRGWAQYNLRVLSKEPPKKQVTEAAPTTIAGASAQVTAQNQLQLFRWVLRTVAEIGYVHFSSEDVQEVDGRFVWRESFIKQKMAENHCSRLNRVLQLANEIWSTSEATRRTLPADASRRGFLQGIQGESKQVLSNLGGLKSNLAEFDSPLVDFTTETTDTDRSISAATKRPDPVHVWDLATGAVEGRAWHIPELLSTELEAKSKRVTCLFALSEVLRSGLENFQNPSARDEFGQLDISVARITDEIARTADESPSPAELATVISVLIEHSGYTSRRTFFDFLRDKIQLELNYRFQKDGGNLLDHLDREFFPQLQRVAPLEDDEDETGVM